MDPSAFKSPEAGEVIPTLTGYHAFVPAPPPPKLNHSDALVLLLSEADAALGELSRLGVTCPTRTCRLRQARSRGFQPN